MHSRQEETHEIYRVSPCQRRYVPNRELRASSDSLSGRTTCSNKALFAAELPTIESNASVSSCSQAVGVGMLGVDTAAPFSLSVDPFPAAGGNSCKEKSRHAHYSREEERTKGHRKKRRNTSTLVATHNSPSTYSGAHPQSATGGDPSVACKFTYNEQREHEITVRRSFDTTLSVNLVVAIFPSLSTF